MTSNLAQWWPLVVAGAAIWAGHMISVAVTAASKARHDDHIDLMSRLSDMRSEIKWTNDSVKRVEQRLPPPPEQTDYIG